MSFIGRGASLFLLNFPISIFFLGINFAKFRNFSAIYQSINLEDVFLSWQIEGKQRIDGVFAYTS